MFGGNFAPRGWALCDGNYYPFHKIKLFFSLLGTIYGGDGRTTFALPDLRGRVAMHAGNGPGLSPRRLGEKGGSENVTLTDNQIPSHNHNVRLGAGDGNLKVGANNYLAVTDLGDDSIWDCYSSWLCYDEHSCAFDCGGISATHKYPAIFMPLILLLHYKEHFRREIKIFVSRLVKKLADI